MKRQINHQGNSAPANTTGDAKPPLRRITVILSPGVHALRVAERRGAIEFTVNRTEWKRLAAMGGDCPARGVIAMLREAFAEMPKPSIEAQIECLAEPYARRFREIEMAADIEPGSILESALEIGRNWWEDDDPSELIGWILAAWNISDPATMERNLAELHAKWRREDEPAMARAAAQEAKRLAGRTDKEREAEEEETAARLARIVATDREMIQRAKAQLAKED